MSGVRLSSPNTLSDEEMASRAGCNLLTESIPLREWLVQQCPTKRLVLGSYAYLDSAEFVKVSLAMDAIASGCLEKRPNSALAYLCSPTDSFAIPPAARAAAAEQWRNGSSLQGLVRTITPDRVLRPNAGGTRPKLPIVDALVLQQGPNYFMAKRLQHWRAMIAAAEGHAVSSNVAPASNTSRWLSSSLLIIE
mmetsp:Transcript_64615/g.179448  ORF Transcript_64615/g.179448 Transcript_64615/m.179448 type:complete len:193 (-) Transcript_64615:590-1168(-)